MASERAKKLANGLVYSWQDLKEATVAELIDKALLEERREAAQMCYDLVSEEMVSGDEPCKAIAEKFGLEEA